MDKTIKELMLFSRSMLSILDTEDLVRFLNKKGCEFLDVKKINMVLVDHVENKVDVYYLDDNNCVKRNVFYQDDDLYQYYIDNNFSIHHEESYYQSYPEHQEHDAYPDIKTYVRTPLNNAFHSFGMLEFINPNIQHEKQFGLLTSMLAAYVSHILEHEIASPNIDLERQQQDRLLVDVTNAVISQSTIESLLHSLMACLNTHFPIQEISLLNPTPDFGFTQRRYSQLSDTAYFQHTFQPDNRFIQVLENDQVAIFSEQKLANLKLQSPSLLLDKSIEQAVLVPLVFRSSKHGFLLYAIDKTRQQQPLDLDLLQQITARVALAMHSLLKLKEVKKNLPVSEYIEIEDTYQHYQIFDDIISQSENMNQVLDQVAMVADCDSTVLILGETGTGKELIAQAIHKMSRRNHKRMVKMNCAAVPSGLFESELFGHERGAFTGAVTQRVGRFEQANQSTLFLDEIGEMPMELQPKLLRVLQESEIERVGKNQLIPVDVRIVVATNANLLEKIQDKTFRSDLYYRLNIFPIEIPPLRERNEDIPLLIKHFSRVLSKKMGKGITKIAYKDMEALSSLDWPGNVRQLRNFIERCVILTRGNILHVPMNDLVKMGLKVQPASNHKPLNIPQENGCKKELSREDILESLRACNGIVAGERGAAKRLGLKRTTLLSRMQKMGITSSDYLSEA
ncbi:sigma 54-interacting transcriptional regulator [Vibrio aphrogenes]|uniref:sigma 54-interacting transcriptional regulator n=1 Tax=Vibrio aphrogenes TaxID=1891186 RepID=UPI000B34E1DD|nr:sigma 54-interacting transcriptional regulator [Vibrio aphrogenes]